MNIQQKFLELAEAYWTSRDRRTLLQHDLVFFGIRFDSEGPPSFYDHSPEWPCGGEYDIYRCNACCLFAAMTCGELRSIGVGVKRHLS